MGNQLTGIAPSQILPVEQYLADIGDYEYQTSLGSTRFFKVARAKYKEGQLVVKVFVIHDPSLPLQIHKHKLEEIVQRLKSTSNCLPFQKAIQSDKAGLIFRQYVKDSLYDRISTRPFLNMIEKKWIAFQLLCALNQSHRVKVFHGDIKSENVMITGWTWLLLTDFASFKPTYLPEDNPSDFSYFFDTSRRRTCYIAPERFIEGGWRNQEAAGNANNIDLTSSEIKIGDLTPAMDIFSAGCVITELFTDGTTPFDLSQLLAYRSGEYSPWKILEKIPDQHVRELVRHMIQKDPKHRLSAEEYLVKQRGKAFPEYFYTFLKIYLQQFAASPIIPADDRITLIKRDLPSLLKNMKIDENKLENNVGLVLIISCVGSCCRNLHVNKYHG
ncbi:phosphoinositide 3-kinase regulatory subunit 4 [Patella vulgata]|uniref:phosphoinositide 3-kinase regulatory subunit 4 n=1 Tax=Patella vulgata TaxID=6465 RepID=UPI0024A9E756|nr:phosphoinositide 3-kinase regulatory subunit 4 [Patella vulgata]